GRVRGATARTGTSATAAATRRKGDIPVDSVGPVGDSAATPAQMRRSRKAGIVVRAARPIFLACRRRERARIFLGTRGPGPARAAHRSTAIHRLDCARILLRAREVAATGALVI